MKYELVNVDHNSMAEHLIRSNCAELCCISNAVAKTYDKMSWNGTEKDGNDRSECDENEGTDCADGDSDTGW